MPEEDHDDHRTDTSGAAVDARPDEDGGGPGRRTASVVVSDVADPGRDHAADAPTASRPRRRLDRGLLIASLVIAGGLILIAWGLIGAVTGDEGVDRPQAIESLSPVENAVQALQQERVVVDLEFGYEAELEIDGILLPTTRIGEVEVEPGEQVDLPPTAVFDGGNSIISFQPTEGAPIESFDEGRHQARVIFWRIDEGREFARSYVWSFDVI